MYDLVEWNVRNLLSLGAPSGTYGKLLVHLLLLHLLIEKIPHNLGLVTSREFDEKVWDLENMLNYFKKKLFANERRASLVDEKLYNPNKCNEIICQNLYQDSKNCVVPIAKENIFQRKVI